MLERHHATGRVGVGWVSGFGLARGAIASTVAHDAHNCMVVGARDASGPADMAVAVARLSEIGEGSSEVQRIVISRALLKNQEASLAGIR